MMPTSDRIPERTVRHQELRNAVLVTTLAFAVALGLAAAVDRGARVLGPVLIVVGSLGGGFALRTWWRHTRERWFVGELALVIQGWGLLACAYASLQYLAFSFIGGAYRIDVDYGKLIAPEFNALWRRDSAQAAGLLHETDVVIQVLRDVPRERLMLDTSYALASGDRVKVAESCLTPAQCEWTLQLKPIDGRRSVELPIRGPDEEASEISVPELRLELQKSARALRAEIAAYGARLADPVAHLEPRIADFLYDTIIAFAGRESGVFVPIGALPRFFRVIADLASFLLFGIVVARWSAAFSASQAGSTGPAR
jgi:hypothetical protein